MGISKITLLKRGKAYVAVVDTSGKKPSHKEIHNFLMTGTRYLDSPRHGRLHITKQK
jgi:hypothetical protein